MSLVACINSRPSTESTMPTATATLIACDEMTHDPYPGSILPSFTPSYHCELEDAYNKVYSCMVHASPELSYPCSQTESAKEMVISQEGHSLLIQRDYHYSAGCWHGVTSDIRSLRACDSESGKSNTLAEDVIGDPIFSPDGAWLAFVAAEPESNRLEPHIFRVRSDGTDLIQLDVQPFPQDQVVGAWIFQWSEDGAWLEVSLWNGRDHIRYHLRSDGSGEFEALP